MGRFPVTLYKEQWLKVPDMSADIRAFIAANEAQLKARLIALRDEEDSPLRQPKYRKP
jgi:hypothetical protein